MKPDRKPKAREEEEEEDLCPMCCEVLDPTDLSFKPCQCGYQMCRFCWHHIKEGLNSKCPACRQPYDPQKYSFTPPDPKEIAKKKKKGIRITKKKPKDISSSPILFNRKNLANVRVIQRNLVYVTNLALNLAKEELLNSEDYFGRYGKIMKIVVNKNNLYNVNSPGGPSVSAYVTYFDEDNAKDAIESLDGSWLGGRTLRASFGTTKYCTFFLKGVTCTNPDCLYLHELGGDDDSFTKEEMGIGKSNFYDQIHPNSLRVNNILSLPNGRGEADGPPGLTKTRRRGNTDSSGSDRLRRSAPISTQKRIRSQSQERVSALPATASWGKRAVDTGSLPTTSPTPPANIPLKPNNWREVASPTSPSSLSHSPAHVGDLAHRLSSSPIADIPSRSPRLHVHDMSKSAPVETPRIPIMPASADIPISQPNHTDEDEEPLPQFALSPYGTSPWMNNELPASPKKAEQNEWEDNIGLDDILSFSDIPFTGMSTSGNRNRSRFGFAQHDEGEKRRIRNMGAPRHASYDPRLTNPSSIRHLRPNSDIGFARGTNTSTDEDISWSFNNLSISPIVAPTSPWAPLGSPSSSPQKRPNVPQTKGGLSQALSQANYDPRRQNPVLHARTMDKAVPRYPHHNRSNWEGDSLWQTRDGYTPQNTVMSSSWDYGIDEPSLDSIPLSHSATSMRTRPNGMHHHAYSQRYAQGPQNAPMYRDPGFDTRRNHPQEYGHPYSQDMHSSARPSYPTRMQNRERGRSQIPQQMRNNGRMQTHMKTPPGFNVNPNGRKHNYSDGVFTVN